MKPMTQRLGLYALALAAALSVAGCSTPKTLYAWGGYQDSLYQSLKGDGKSSPEQQIQGLEEGLQTMASKGASAPPGYYAHLGLLYLQTGRTDQSATAWQKEKSLFPESAKYMDFLLNNMKKNGG
ncbi:DUF4810 domain-containing protein [Aquabacterium sp.]|uniref:DUF4810 domain-containing protein n=1 Tax=Aquabacterium sp. TaxID=1872578 RepID=UPI00345B9E9A